MPENYNIGVTGDASQLKQEISTIDRQISNIGKDANPKILEDWKENSKKSTYVMFRTVSNKSPASSWVVNKGKINDENFSKTTLKHIDYLAKWRAKNLFK